ncbi:MAG: hypothetical protein RLZZ383_2559 [Pseudomonadota bacterium]|jgi:hypothetical protein
MTSSLLDRWCPEPHDAPITAAAYDPRSGTTVTADELGLVAVRVGRERAPSVLVERDRPILRAVAVSRGGKRIAVGDEDGRLVVFASRDAAVIWADERKDEAGHRDLAVRAVCFSPDGRSLASLHLDGRVRVVDLDSGRRIGTFPDFLPTSLDWDPAGRGLLAVDAAGQPAFIDLRRREKLGFPLIPGGARAAKFTADGQAAIVLGGGGLYRVDLGQQAITAHRAADRSSGMLDLLAGPEPDAIAVLSARSIHVFHASSLQHLRKFRHGAPDPTGVALWDDLGLAAADHSGRWFRPDHAPSVPPTIAVFGRGDLRLASHDQQIAIWRAERRVRVFVPTIPSPEGDGVQRPLLAEERVVELACDLDGRVIAALAEGQPLHLFDAQHATWIGDAGPDSAQTRRFDVATGVVALLLEAGGVRWFDLRHDRTFDLAWARDFALTGGGNWLAVLTPKGRVRLLQPATGEDAIAGLGDLPTPGDAPIQLLAFVHRRPELLVLDAEGVLALIDLLPAARDGGQPVLHRIAAFQDVEIDALWGTQDGRHAVVRLQEPADGTATVVTVDLDDGSVVHEVRGLLPYVQVDPSRGALLEPGRGSASLERSLDGTEDRVLRSLPGGEWISFDARRLREPSSGATTWIGDGSDGPRAVVADAGPSDASFADPSVADVAPAARPPLRGRRRG